MKASIKKKEAGEVTVPKEFTMFLISLQSLTVFFRNHGTIDDIEDRFTRVFTRALDSMNKPEGVIARYSKALHNDDGTVTPYNGTKYLLLLLKISEEEYKAAKKHANI